ncbi:MAG: hypothetical protein EOP04_10245 [Proteobacteria bacterium]|nr:MAG: hypothetical protein EOP04_10245 [Pseudomonadota bacterium]
MLKILPMILRALMLLTMIYSLNAIAQEAAPVGPTSALTLDKIPPEVLDKMTASDLGDIIRMQLKKPQNLSEAIFDGDTIPAIMGFGSLAASAFFISYFSYRKRIELIRVAHDAAKGGHPLNDSFLEVLEGGIKISPQADLRKAVILIALGLSSITIIFFVSHPGERGVSALGILPLLLGCAYFYLWKTSRPSEMIAIKRND